MGTRETPAHDSAYDTHTSTVRTDGDRSDRRPRISRDDAFHVLQDEGRRAVIRFLLAKKTEEPTPLSTLAAFIAAVKYGDSESTAVGEVQERVRVALHHSHLPVLEDHGLVVYDHATRTVEPRPLLTALDPFLEDGLDAERDLTVDPDRAEDRGLGGAR
ncbi:hypothetical protein C474_12371 [Halogeometricum pallidum JCM 14848]|uniref:DUF7344 domain-containing protein n=1 Tax=Halogeometricum pallidum JCM 14848 TaxID=1227487 RepID=M0D6P2_HALPD|nr:hypothetical protein [Halogeometricum pallidum]ELZ29829.1 hypothetical protein C474_12371 [Halogeometricum pallidum JCM 14848]